MSGKCCLIRKYLLLKECLMGLSFPRQTTFQTHFNSQIIQHNRKMSTDQSAIGLQIG